MKTFVNDGRKEIVHKLTVPYSGFSLNSTSGYYEQTISDSTINANTNISHTELNKSCVGTAAMETVYNLLVAGDTVAGGILIQAYSAPTSDVIVDFYEVK